MADTQSPELEERERALTDLPAKIRVFALAKRLSLTSKQLMARLADLGVQIKSPQSSMDRPTAKRVIEDVLSATAEPADEPANMAEPVDEVSDTSLPGWTLDNSLTVDSTIGQASSDDAAASFSQVSALSALFRAPGESLTHEPPRATDAASLSEATVFAQADAANPNAANPNAANTDTERVATSAMVKGTMLFSGIEEVSPLPVDQTSTRSTRAPNIERPLFLPPAENAPIRRATLTQKTSPSKKRSDGEFPDRDESIDSTAKAGGEDVRVPSDSDVSDEFEGKVTRHRKRGRRGRNRGRGGGTDNSVGEAAGGVQSSRGTHSEPLEDDPQPRDDSNTDTSVTASRDEDSSEGDNTDEGVSTHRRRRRRISGEPRERSNRYAASGDARRTVVRERRSRGFAHRTTLGSDGVRGITGSTRLEAKRRRRQETREADRFRSQILSESEFLEQRESVDRVMVIRERERSDHPGITTQVGVLENGLLVEHFVTSDQSSSMIGNVYLGRVQNVLPSMEAAFIDIGQGRNAVLYAGELSWDDIDLGGKSRKIENALHPGDQIVVQATKDPVGHKGSRLTTQISLPGRFLVYVPGVSASTGISRKLPEQERKRLKEIIKDIVTEDVRIIIRTAAQGVSAEMIEADVKRLRQQWNDIQVASKKANKIKGNAAQTLYTEPEMLVRVVRDLFNEGFSKIVIQGDNAWTVVQRYIGDVAPDLLDRVERYDGSSGDSNSQAKGDSPSQSSQAKDDSPSKSSQAKDDSPSQSSHSKTSGGVASEHANSDDHKSADVFEQYGIDEQILKALEREVTLPSGGSLVIDRTEAMTVVDVNTGKFTGEGGNLEETVTRNNLEAAEEIVRQLRLRDIGGMIVVDFIDMVLESNRDLVLRRLTEMLGSDRTRHQVSEVTSLGLVQMTRKRIGTGLVEAFSHTCEACQGRGIILQPDPVEAVTNGQNAEDFGDRRHPGSRNRKKSDPATKTNNTGPNPAEHPLVKAMAQQKGTQATGLSYRAGKGKDEHFGADAFDKSGSDAAGINGETPAASTSSGTHSEDSGSSSVEPRLSDFKTHSEDEQPIGNGKSRTTRGRRRRRARRDRPVIRGNDRLEENNQPDQNRASQNQSGENSAEQVQGKQTEPVQAEKVHSGDRGHGKKGRIQARQAQASHTQQDHGQADRTPKADSSSRSSATTVTGDLGVADLGNRKAQGRSTSRRRSRRQGVVKVEQAHDLAATVQGVSGKAETPAPAERQQMKGTEQARRRPRRRRVVVPQPGRREELASKQKTTVEQVAEPSREKSESESRHVSTKQGFDNSDARGQATPSQAGRRRRRRATRP